MDYTPRKKIHAYCPEFSVNNCYDRYTCNYFYHDTCKDNFICNDPDCQYGHGLSLIKRMLVSSIYDNLYEHPIHDVTEECNRYFNCTNKKCTFHHHIPLEHRWTICNIINADTDEDAEEIYKASKTSKIVSKKQKDNDLASKASTKFANSPPASYIDEEVKKGMSYVQVVNYRPCVENGINSWIEKTVSETDEIQEELPENINEDTNNLMEILNKTTIKTDTNEISTQTDLTMSDIDKLEEVKKMYKKISQHIKSLK